MHKCLHVRIDIMRLDMRMESTRHRRGAMQERDERRRRGGVDVHSVDLLV